MGTEIAIRARRAHWLPGNTAFSATPVGLTNLHPHLGTGAYPNSTGLSHVKPFIRGAITVVIVCVTYLLGQGKNLPHA